MSSDEDHRRDWRAGIAAKLRAAEPDMSAEGFPYWSSLALEAARQVDLAESILRRLLGPASEPSLDEHYVDLEHGVINVRLDLTEAEREYVARLLG